MNRLIPCLLLALALTGCTENRRALSWGGTATMDIAPGQKVVNVTFKEANLWVLTRAARPGETPEVYLFKEKSSVGLAEGTVILREHD